jgi:Ca2+-transporting ATPase
MLGRREWTNIVWTGALQAAVTLGVFVWALRTRDLGEARNLAFTTLVFGELFRSFASRSTTKLFWEVGAFTNLRLLGVVIASVMIQIGIHHIPVLAALFQLRDLPLRDSAVTLLFGLIPVTVIELAKLARRLRNGDPVS